MKQRLISIYVSNMIKMFLITLTISLLTSNLFAQNIKKEQVHFDKGTTSKTIESSITGDETVDYVLNVRKGQAINVSMATDNTANYFNIMEPNEEYVAIFNGSINDNMYEGILNKSGNYTIRVYLMRSAARRNEKANYRLEMIISPLTKPSHDTKVAGTNYHATGKIRCQMGEGQSAGNCDFGVVREGNGTAQVTITKPDGSTRSIYFENGKAIGYDKSQADRGEFKASKEGYDLYIIHIGNERYEIPDAVISGG